LAQHIIPKRPDQPLATTGRDLPPAHARTVPMTDSANSMNLRGFPPWRVHPSTHKEKDKAMPKVVNLRPQKRKSASELRDELPYGRRAFLELEEPIRETLQMSQIASIIEDYGDDGLRVFSLEMTLRAAEALQKKYDDLDEADPDTVELRAETARRSPKRRRWERDVQSP
jgi:hypothetical protein